MVSIIARTIIIYFLLAFSLRIMGKRQIGELDISELVSTLLISELAAIPIDDPDIPLLNEIIPMLFILSAEIILSTIKNKSAGLKKTIDGTPTYIIYKGRLLQNELTENRISVNELLSEMRAKGIGDIGEIHYAILENNGTLSLLKNSDSPLAHPIIIDGEVLKDKLRQNGLNEGWLKKRLSENGISAEEIFLMTVTDDGQINLIRKDKTE